MSHYVPPPGDGLTSRAGTGPFVSVLLPVHDGEAFLAAAIDSILQQSYANLELIVIDDGSTDASAAIAAACQDPRIRLVRNDRNLGLVETLNRGFELARGELLARMDADDVAAPERIERQVQRFIDDPRLVALGTGIRHVDRIGREIGVPARQVQGPQRLRWRLLRGTCVYHPTLMVHRARAAGDLRYDPLFEHAEDYELVLRLSRRHSVDNVPGPLMALRQHPGSISRRFGAAQRNAAARALTAHARVAYGFDLGYGQAQAVIDPRFFVSGLANREDLPVRATLELERRFLECVSSLSADDRAAVRRDVAFVCARLAAIALLDWRRGPCWSARAVTLGAAVAQLLRRPRAAFAALLQR